MPYQPFGTRLHTCPACAAPTVPVHHSQEERCLSCDALVRRVRNVVIVQPRGFRPEATLV